MPDEPGSGSWLSNIANAAKLTLEVIGLAVAAGTGLAAVAFSVGYLAVKQHDKMLGLVSATNYTQYVRTGVEFVPRSLYGVGVWVAQHFVWFVISTIAVALLCALSLAGSEYAARRKPHGGARNLTAATAVRRWWTALLRTLAALPEWRSAELRSLGVLLALLALVLFTSFQLRGHLAALHPINTALLPARWDASFLREPKVGDIYRLLHTPMLQRSRITFADSVGTRDSVRSRQTVRPASLLSPEHRLLAKYGATVAVALIVVFALISVNRWRKRALDDLDASAESAPNLSRATRGLIRSANWIVFPAAVLLAALLVLTLPSLYGVLAMSNTYPCGEVKTAGEARPNSAATTWVMSDISGKEKNVLLFQWGEGGTYDLYTLEQVPLDSIRQFVGHPCEVNLLASKPNVIFTPQ